MSPTLTLVGHDGDLSPSRLQLAQPSLISTKRIDAGGEDAQAQVAVLAQERSQFAGTVGAGAPGDETGDPVVLLRVQLPGRDQPQEAPLCVAAGLLCVSALRTEERGSVVSLAVNKDEGGTQVTQVRRWPPAQN